MSVDVDYGAGHIIYNVDATPAYTDPTSAQVQARGDSVYIDLLNMEATADYAAAAATAKILALREFSAAVGAVTFTVPPAPNAVLQALPSISTLDLVQPEVTRSDLGTNFRYNLADATAQSWATPLTPGYTAPEKPGLTTPGTLPAGPAEYVFPDVSVPILEITDFSPTDVIAPDINLIDFEYSAELVIEPLELVVDTSGLDAAITAYEDYDPTPPVLPEYLYLIPEVFSVTGSMAGGDIIIDYVRLLAARDGLLISTAPSTASAIDRRGLPSVSGAAQYDAWLNGKTHATLNVSDTVFVAKAVDATVEAALQLGTAAHRMLVDIETSLYDLEFRAAKAVVQGQLLRAQATVAIYNANVLVLQGYIAEYNAQAAAIVGAAKGFEVQAQEAMILAQANTTLADSFSATERAKRVAAQVFKSQINAEAAKLTQYKAYLETYEAQVQAARADVEQFSGDVTRYAAEIDRLASEYGLYSAEVRTVQTNNAAIAATAQAQQAELRGIAAQADSAAAGASVKAVELQARAAIRETAYIKRAIHNEEESAGLGADASAVNLAISEYVAELTSTSMSFAGKSALARAVASYVSSASESVARAATLTQTANKQLAGAYEQVYVAAGKAGAAVASGKLSGFRAHATMGASENLAASRSYGVGISHSGTNSYGEANNYNATIGA